MIPPAEPNGALTAASARATPRQPSATRDPSALVIQGKTETLTVGRMQRARTATDLKR
jgi:hypothetical protein